MTRNPRTQNEGRTDSSGDGVTRREFIAETAALGVTLATVSLSHPAQAATPKKGGRFRLGLAQGALTDSLDPATFENRVMYCLNWAVRNFLTEIGPDNQLAPELAQSWEPSSDATEWVFKLRKDVEFHDGKSLVAEDVIASMNHHRGADSKSGARSLLEQITEIRAHDKHTVSFRLISGNADFPYVLQDFHLPIMPSDGAGNVLWQGGNGTGAYILKRFEPGESAFMTRNPNYWKEGRGHFDDVELLVISDPQSRQTALISDAIDAMDDCDLKTIHLLAANPDIEVDETTSGSTHGFPMLANRSPFDNNDVRLAMKFAIDRKAYLKTILRGHGAIGNDNPIGPSLPFYAELPKHQYDPDKAKFHLQKAGVSSLDVDLHCSDIAWSGAVDSSVLYREHAAKAGINIKVVREPNDGFWDTVWRKAPFSTSGWAARPVPDLILSLVYASDASWNETYWKNERFDELLVLARSELDNKKRSEMYHEAQRIVWAEGSTVIPAFQNFVYARRSRVQHGAQLSSAFDLDGYKAVERWWFA